MSQDMVIDLPTMEAHAEVLAEQVGAWDVQTQHIDAAREVIERILPREDLFAAHAALARFSGAGDDEDALDAAQGIADVMGRVLARTGMTPDGDPS